MGTNIFLLNPSHSKKSTLDKAYYNHINNILSTLNEEEEGRWEIYSVIIQQLVGQGKEDYFKEIKYRLTDGEDPNSVILDIINRESEDMDSLTWFFKKKIEEYVEDDYLKRFLR
jgi:hypothetical protein